MGSTDYLDLQRVSGQLCGSLRVPWLVVPRAVAQGCDLKAVRSFPRDVLRAGVGLKL